MEEKTKTNYVQHSGKLAKEGKLYTLTANCGKLPEKNKIEENNLILKDIRIFCNNKLLHHSQRSEGDEINSIKIIVDGHIDFLESIRQVQKKEDEEELKAKVEMLRESQKYELMLAIQSGYIDDELFDADEDLIDKPI